MAGPIALAMFGKLAAKAIVDLSSQASSDGMSACGTMYRHSQRLQRAERRDRKSTESRIPTRHRSFRQPRLAQAIQKSVHQFRVENGRASSEGRNRQAGLQAEQMRYRVT